MKKMLEMEIKKLWKVFPKAFINTQNAMILNASKNIYFSLDGVTDVLSLKCKFIAWFSRPSCKGSTKRSEDINRGKFNKYLGTKFNRADMMKVYTLLGNDIDRPLCERFVNSGLDMNTLK